MAVLMRGGAYADFDPSKLKPREWAVVLENDPSARDGKAIYICFASGNVKRISTYEDMHDDLLTATDDIRQQYINAFNEIKDEVEQLHSQTEVFKNESQAQAQASASSAQSASDSAQTATQKESAASQSAVNAADSADASEGYSNYSKSYAVGTNGVVRASDETDNSKYYKEECQRLMQEIERLIASVSSGGLIAAGTVTFENLPAEPQTNYMYNISNDFVTDDRFEVGAGVPYSRGTNVYWSVAGKWDILTGVMVLGVKGEAETEYHTGYVNITKDSLGLGNLKPVAFSGSYNDLTDKPENLNTSEINYVGQYKTDLSIHAANYTNTGGSKKIDTSEGLCYAVNYSDNSSVVYGAFKLPVKINNLFCDIYETWATFPIEQIARYTTDNNKDELQRVMFPCEAFLMGGTNHARRPLYGHVDMANSKGQGTTTLHFVIEGISDFFEKYYSNESSAYLYIYVFIK